MINKLIGGAAISAVEGVGNVLDELFTSDEERLDKQALLTRLAQQPNLAQVELNKIEAAHRSIFVAGWRPFVGWVAGFSLAYQYIIRDLISWAMPENVPPELATGELTTVLLALLGLGSLRTVEKLQGRAK